MLSPGSTGGRTGELALWPTCPRAVDIDRRMLVMQPDSQARIQHGGRGDRRPALGRVVIVGGGVGGLSVALLLGRQGRDVLLCERDPAPVPAGTEEMWSDWPRPGVPQSRLGH